MPRKLELNPHDHALIDKATLITVEQVDKAAEVLLQMGVGGTHPQREYLLALVMQTLATNFLACVEKAKD